jgi:hypothetical protein
VPRALASVALASNRAEVKAMAARYGAPMGSLRVGRWLAIPTLLPVTSTFSSRRRRARPFSAWLRTSSK